MPDDLYAADILRWSGQQADLLRRLARGERVTDAIDWENVIEEVESVGRSELSAVKILLRHALGRLIKVHFWPAGPVEEWRHEALDFLSDAEDRFSPSMRREIDLSVIWRKAVAAALPDGRPPPRPLPAQCPFALADLLPASDHSHASVQALFARLAAASG
jgi:hypothetical protein